jgi:6-pyruvoyltetrahydropterin/6-carboxytetrahydropterin synthase
MYTVTRRIEFCYGHRLLDYAGKCKHLHGHNGLAVIELSAEALDAKGMVVDFSEIRDRIKNWIDENLDHRLILSKKDPALAKLQELGEPVYVIDTNPTAEAIAKLLFDKSRVLELPVVRVDLWETPNCMATYCEGPAAAGQ